MNQIAVGVITVSDRAFQGVYEDLGGPALREAATRYGWRILAEAIVPDDIDRIRETIRSFSAQSCALCYTQAAASGSRMIQALKSGILILIAPPTFMTIGLIFVCYRKRNQTRNDSAESGSDWGKVGDSGDFSSKNS